MNWTAVSIGSNSHDREEQVKRAMEFLSGMLADAGTSTIYGTPAINGKDADYANAVTEGGCDDDFDELNAKLKDYEARCGRCPGHKQNGEVPIDLDIVIWNGNVLRERDYERDYFKRGWKQLHNEQK
jgi:2-amino-4-hydroxy-6-hydroxymethyldihydropteridine diphosphokinase